MSKIEKTNQLTRLARQLYRDGNSRLWYEQERFSWMAEHDGGEATSDHHGSPKRIHANNLYIYSLPVLAAFSLARNSLISLRKDPWHSDDNPYAWYIGERSLSTGEMREPAVLSSSIDRGRLLWLQVAPPEASNWPAGQHSAYQAEPRNQQRYELRLDANYRATRAEYRHGLRAPVVYEDIVAIDSLIRRFDSQRIERLASAAQREDDDLLVAS